MKTRVKAKRLPRALVFAAGLLMVGAALFKLWPSTLEDLASADVHGTPAATGTPTGLAELEGVDEPALDLPHLSAARVEADATSPLGTLETRSGATVITGRVYASTGAPTPPLGGTMRAVYFEGSSMETVTVEVGEGRFQFEVSGPGMQPRPTPVVDSPFGGRRPSNRRAPYLRFNKARFGGDSYVFTGGSGNGCPSSTSRDYIVDSAAIVLSVKLIPVTVLTVVDAASRAPLSGVTVTHHSYLREFTRLSLPWANGSLAIAEDAASPIELAEPPPRFAGNLLVCWVGCEGYGWEKISIDAWRGGERLVPLQRAGRLKIEIVGDWPPEHVVTFTRDGSDESLFRVPQDAGRTQVFDELPPGTYTATATTRYTKRPGGPYSSTGSQATEPAPRRELLATAQATVSSGTTSTLRLVIPVPTAPRGAKITGVIIVPPGWSQGRPGRELLASFRGDSSGAPDPHLLILREDMRGGDQGGYAFEVEQVPIGPCIFELHPGLHCEPFEVPEDGAHDLRFEVSPPCEIHVRPVDGETGDPVQVTELRWRRNSDDGISQWARRAPRRKTADGSYSLQVAEGSVTLRCDSSSHDSGIKDVIAAHGLEVTLPLYVSIKGDIELKHQGTRVPWPARAELELQSVDGPGELNPLAPTTLRTRVTRSFSVTQPGRYLVDVPEVPGFRPQAPIQIEMRRGERNLVTIELVPD